MQTHVTTITNNNGIDNQSLIGKIIERKLKVEQFQSLLNNNNKKNNNNNNNNNSNNNKNNNKIILLDTRHIPTHGIIESSYWISHLSQLPTLLSNYISSPSLSQQLSSSLSSSISPQLLLIIQPNLQKQIISKLVHNGYVNILGYNGFGLEEWKGKYAQIQLLKYQEINKINIKQAEHQSNYRFITIDVRNKEECLQTGVFQGSYSVPISQLEKRIHDVAQYVNNYNNNNNNNNNINNNINNNNNTNNNNNININNNNNNNNNINNNNNNKKVIVHCKTGNRGRLAGSILARQNIGQIIVLNDNIIKLQQNGIIKLVKYVEN